MAKRVVIGALVGGLLYFIWGAVAHMATPIGTMGLSTLPADREPPALAAIKAAAPGAGLYFYPGMDMSGKATEAEQKEWEARAKAGPMGLLLVAPEGVGAMTPAQLGTEFAIDVLVMLIASILLSMTRVGYVGRVVFLTLLGLFAFASISLSYWNWYHFPIEFTIAVALEEGIGMFLVGLVVAAIVRQPEARAGEASGAK